MNENTIAENPVFDAELPPQTLGLIRSFAAESQRILGDNLVGVYLHGSSVI